mgnify:CR=1 FL=1
MATLVLGAVGTLVGGPLGGALGAAWLQLSLMRGWVRQELDGRALALTPKAVREMPELFAGA